MTDEHSKTIAETEKLKIDHSEDLQAISDTNEYSEQIQLMVETYQLEETLEKVDPVYMQGQRDLKEMDQQIEDKKS